jgi:hypothetical protein
MKILTAVMTGAALIALTPNLVIADDSAMSFPVHDIIVSSNIPALNISVRNQSQSTNPAQRNLRVVSQAPVVNVAGQVWCKSFQNAQTRADTARVIFGNGGLASSPGGSNFLGGWSPSPVAELGGDEEVRNYTINAPVNLPDQGAVWIGLNPVHHVEERLQNFVQNGAGSEADFLRVDDVFETTIKVNVVGWCEYEGQNVQGRYAGYRQIEVPVHIFYHGDPDIQDAIVGVGTANTLQAPVPGPGPSFSPGQPSRRATPPARRTPPARGSDSRTRYSASGAAAALLPSTEKRVQRVQQRIQPPVLPADPHGSAGDGGVWIASGDVNGDGTVGLLLPAIQKMQDAPPAAAEQPGCAGLGSTLRREAARAVFGMLLGSGRSRRDAERPSLQDRMVDTVVDEAAGCRPATGSMD